MERNIPFIQKATYLLLFVILLVYVLVQARIFLIPVAFGFLLSSLLSPVCKFFRRAGIPKGLSIFLSVVLMIVIFGGVTMLMVHELSKLAGDFREIRQKALENVNSLYLYVEDHFGVDVEWQKKIVKSRVEHLFTAGSDFLNRVLNGTTGTIFILLMMPVYVFYLMYNRERFRQFVIRMAPADRKGVASTIMKEMSFISQRFFGGALIVVLILIVINSLGLLIIGVRYPVLFGVISAVMNFIPYFGTWIGAFFPFTFALLTGDSITLALKVLIFFAFIQFTENNILTPHITGGNVRLNPIFTIMGLVAAGLIWGVAGMLLVIPFLAGLKIIFENIESTKPLAFLLSNPHETTLTRFRKFFRNIFKSGIKS